MLIKRGAVREYLARDFDDFRWMKRLTRERVTRELDALKVRPRFKTEPWLHQLVCFYVGLVHPRFLFLLDMGLGKSKIIADLITQAQRERKLEGALVTVPRKINIDSWRDDLLVHSDLEPWPVNVSDTDEKWERLIRPRGDVTIIDYQGLHWALCKKEKAGKGKKFSLVRDDRRVEALMRRYNFIDLDESQYLRSHENLWFGIVNQISKRAEFIYANTGTLFGKDVEALWSQFYLVDRGETFGDTLGLFRKALFTAKPNPWKKGEDYVFDKAMEPKLHAMLQHRSLRYDENEVLDLPARVYRPQRLDMGDEQREHYLRALEGLINAGGVLADLEAAWVRMRQITSGYLAWNDAAGRHAVPFRHNPKLDALEALIDAMGDSKIVVCYDYTETGRLITERVKQVGLGFEWFYGGTKDKTASRRRFMEDDDCRVFVMNSEAGGTGNDGLQKVARYMVFFESPTPPDKRKQTEKRIHRPGQAQRVFIYDLVMRRSLDGGILDDIKAGIDCYDAVVNGRRKNKGFFLHE